VLVEAAVHRVVFLDKVHPMHLCGFQLCWLGRDAWIDIVKRTVESSLVTTTALDFIMFESMRA
jgi:hypothetical protein